MPSHEKDSYLSLGAEEDLDLENDSDTTLASSGFLGKESTRRAKKSGKTSRLQSILTWGRWIIVIILQSTMILLLVDRSQTSEKGWTQTKTETGGDINGLYIPSELFQSSWRLMAETNTFKHHIITHYLHRTSRDSYPICHQMTIEWK